MKYLIVTGVIAVLLSTAATQAQTTERRVGYIVVLELSGNMLADQPVNVFDSEAECVKELETKGSPKLNSIFRPVAAARYHKFLNAHAVIVRDTDNNGNPRWTLTYVGCGIEAAYAPTMDNQAKTMHADFENLLDEAVDYVRSVEGGER